MIRAIRIKPRIQGYQHSSASNRPIQAKRAFSLAKEDLLFSSGCDDEIVEVVEVVVVVVVFFFVEKDLKWAKILS